MKAPIHPILARHLRSLGIDPDHLPPDLPWLADLAADVGSYYEELELLRNHLEESLRGANEEIRRLEDTVSELRSMDAVNSVEHYMELFERTPIPTWEEDFHGVANWLADLRADGVRDLPRFLEENPEAFSRVVSLIRVTNVNGAAAQLVGAADEVALLGPLRPEVLDTDAAPSFLAQMEAVWNSADSVSTPVVGTRLDGDKFDGIIEWRVFKVGNVFDYSRVLVTIVDITDQKLAERKARASLQSRDELLASVTHELRTPLTAVMGFAEILKAMDQGDYEEERDGLLTIIANQASDLSDLVEDLLTNARSELGQLTVVSVPVNIHAQLAQVQESRPDSERPLIVPERRHESVVALGDPQRVRQILRNLVTNATRYGGPVLRVEVETGPKTVTVRVMDNGDGLSTEAEARVFDRYYRDEKSPAHPQSVGLGLTISRDLAQLMGGSLAYRRVDGWTSFDLTLPSA